MMKCKYCGKEFEPKTGNQKFCCEYCCNHYFWKKLDTQRREGTWVRKNEKPKSVFKEKDYKQNFKNYCVSCGKPIDMDWGHYVAYGNYCKECDRKAFENSQHNIEPVEYKIIRKALVGIGATI